MRWSLQWTWMPPPSHSLRDRSRYRANRNSNPHCDATGIGKVYFNWFDTLLLELRFSPMRDIPFVISAELFSAVDDLRCRENSIEYRIAAFDAVQTWSRSSAHRRQSSSTRAAEYERTPMSQDPWKTEFCTTMEECVGNTRLAVPLVDSSWTNLVWTDILWWESMAEQRMV